MSGLPAPMAALLDEIQVVVNHFALNYDTGILIQSFAFCHSCQVEPCECPGSEEVESLSESCPWESLSSSSSD